MGRFLGHLLIATVLTVLTQIGGIAWILALCFRRRLLTFLLCYGALSVAAVFVAPGFGRVPLSCGTGSSLQVQSWMYCGLNRHYVTPELKTTLEDMATAMVAEHPGTVTQVLDANFPFIAGFPLLPHLSHHDGRKVDLAFYYADAGGYLPGAVKSPIGYFAFEPGPTQCPKGQLGLRWDMGWLQGAWPALELDRPRMIAALRWLARDPRVGKVFLEPHLKASLGVQSDKIRFQGCRAARHDDHIHLQL